MRVLMLAQFYAPVVGGEERMTEAFAHGLAARGHEVQVATLRHPTRPATETQGDVVVHRLPGLVQRVSGLFSDDERRHAPPFADPQTTRALRALLSRFDPDVVHAHNWLDHAYLPLAGRSRAAYVLHLHDGSLVCATKRLIYDGAPCPGPEPARCRSCAADHYGRASGPAIARLVRRSSARRRAAADRLLPISAYIAQVTGLAGGGTPYEVLPNFVPDRAPATGTLPLPDEPFLLCAGDQAIDKGVGVLLDAYARLEDPPPLVLLGRTVDIDPATLPPGVLALGPVPHEEVLAAWDRAMLAIVPSVLPEAFGLVALEAMRAGRPVVASRAGGLAEVVDERSGLLVPPGDPIALAGALSALLADPGRRATLGAGAAERARAFSAGAILPRLEAAYEAALQHRAHRRAAA